MPKPSQEDDSPLAHIDMLMVDKLRWWADNFEVHGTDLSQWSDPPKWPSVTLREIADGIERAIKAVPPSPRPTVSIASASDANAARGGQSTD